MSRRPLPPYLRVVGEPTAEAEPCRAIVPALAGSSGNVAALYLEPYARAGRDIITRAAEVIAAEAARHGLTGRVWEVGTLKEAIRPLIAEYVGHAMTLELTGGEES
jgi:hypothetical protein